eukprot:2937809-Prymnesium_polylepis.1
MPLRVPSLVPTPFQPPEEQLGAAVTSLRHGRRAHAHDVTDRAGRRQAVASRPRRCKHGGVSARLLHLCGTPTGAAAAACRT